MESKKPKIRVSIPSIKTTSISRPHHFLFFIITIINTTATASPFYESYSKHCDQIVPASNPTTLSTDDSSRSFRIDTGFFSAAPESLKNATNGINSFKFSTFRVSRTENNDVLYLKSFLKLEELNSTSWLFSHGRNRSVYLHKGGGPRYFRPRLRTHNEEISFQLEGFWSSSSGNLCMVGSGSSITQEGTYVIHNVMFKLNYPNATTIGTSLVDGVVESLDLSNNSLSSFDPIRVLGVSDKNYEYTLIEKEGSSEKFGDDEDNRSIGLAPKGDVCTDTDFNFVRRMHTFELDYSNDECDNCNPFGSGFDVLPRFMIFEDIRCSENGRMHFLIWLRDPSYNSFRRPFHTQTLLAAEGLWDVNKNLLRVVACRISHSIFLAYASVGDCSFKLSLRFSPSLSLRHMRVVKGRLWNNISENDRGHLARVGFSEVMKMDVQGLTYDYTEIDNVKNICAKNAVNKHKGSIYPGENSSDLRFMMTLKSIKGQGASGWFYPLFVNNNVYSARYDNSNSDNRSSVPFNVSYYVTFRPRFSSNFTIGKLDKLSERVVEIFAEGVYDRQTGFLCMKGCRHLDSYQRNLAKNGSLDCEILVNFQYRPLNSKVQDTMKGTIKSTRPKSDSLYFDPIEVSRRSFYARQAAKTISRMDVEIAMVLLSYTIACVFVGLQLYYVKKHPNVLPFISVVMLIVLTLGHMIPLLLNFEALFLTNPNRGNLYFDDGGWVEKNQVIVRVVTMIAFLLQTRLLQQTWWSRSGDDDSQKNLWISEKKVVFLTLPVYIFGGSVTYFVYKWFHSSTSFLHGRHLRVMGMGHLPVLERRQNFLWRDFKSYGGLIMDSFLLPQILFNLFFNSKEKALAPSYYIGTTVLRLLPHAYDLYRSHSANRVFDASYIYANHKTDLYSTAWDLIIPCFGFLFAGIVYLQQRFGGRFFLPKRYQESSEYEKVAVTNGA